MMIASKDVKTEDWEMIWSTCSEHKEFMFEFFKILKEITPKLDVLEVQFFIHKIAEKPVAKLKEHDIEMLNNL